MKPVGQLLAKKSHEKGMASPLDQGHSLLTNPMHMYCFPSWNSKTLLLSLIFPSYFHHVAEMLSSVTSFPSLTIA